MMAPDRSDLAGNSGLVSLAITGLAFEFPQEATSVEGFWQMLCEGRSASTEFPKDRLNIDAFYHPDYSRQSTVSSKNRHTYSSFEVFTKFSGQLHLRGGNFLKEDLGVFDAPFFSISPTEAACMDPQHRRMLETAYHTLEDG